MKRRVEIGILYSRSGNYRLVSDACRAGACSAILYEGFEGNEHAVYMHACAHRPRQGASARRDPFSPCAAQYNPADRRHDRHRYRHTQLTPDSTVADLPALDFGKINPVTGPLFVERAEPGDALKATIEEFKPSGFARLEQEIPSVMRKVGDEPSRLVLTDIGGGHLVADATAIN